MMSAATAFALFLSLNLAAAVSVGLKYGKERALGVGMAGALLAASWFEVPLGVLQMGVPSATAAVLLIAMCLHSGNRIWTPITILDILMIGLVAWHIIVDVYFGGDVARTAFTAYGEWALPYLAGRYAFSHRDSLATNAPWFAGAAAILGATALFEAITSTNVWENLFVPRDDRVWFSRELRYGIAYRANGPLRHAIFIGVLLLSLIPWAISLVDSAELDRRRKTFGIVALALIAAGILATVSRGPILAMILIGVIAACCRSQVFRWVTVGLVTCGIVLAVLVPGGVIQWLESQPDRQSSSTIVVLDEDSEAVIQSATRNRLLVVQIYGPLVLKGGLLGYGSVNSQGFPPANIPGLTSDPEVLSQIGIVDNTFISMGLRFGVVGFGLLLLCFIAAASTAFAMAPDASTFFYPHSTWTMIGLGATIAAVGLELLTVYFDYDHAFWVLFLLGTAAGLRVSSKAEPEDF